MEKLIVILGPTASGKTALSIKIAKKFGGEIVSADSRQVYKGMNLGTGKITKKEMQGIPHYLLDVASPKRRFTVAQYKKSAIVAINKILRKKKIPLLVGGSGFHIQAVTEGLMFPKVKPDLILRKRLERKKTEELFGLLKKLDPKRAKNIDGKNRRRLIRALEIIKNTKKPVPPLKKALFRFDVLKIGIKKPISEFKKLIKKRLLKRLENGMIAEVKGLKKSGLSWKKLEDFGLEYRHIAEYLQKKISYKEMKEKIQKESEHYVKRQMTWFKRDKNIRWIRNEKKAEKLVGSFLEKNKLQKRS